VYARSRRLGTKSKRTPKSIPRTFVPGLGVPGLHQVYTQQLVPGFVHHEQSVPDPVRNKQQSVPGPIIGVLGSVVASNPVGKGSCSLQTEPAVPLAPVSTTRSLMVSQQNYLVRT
jgi:hypothetical protein